MAKGNESIADWIDRYLYWRIKDLYASKMTDTISLDPPFGDVEAGTPLMDARTVRDDRSQLLYYEGNC